MSFSNLYNRMVLKETQTGKTLLVPRKVYKILSYQLVDGPLKSYTGPNTAYVFIIGITPDRVVHGLKISEVQPIKFFSWLKLNLKNNLKYEQIAEKINSNKFEEITVVDTKLGSKFFQKVKTNIIYNQQPGSYRTYRLKNIKLVKEVTFDPEKVLKLIGIPKSVKSESNTKNS